VIVVMEDSHVVCGNRNFVICGMYMIANSGILCLLGSKTINGYKNPSQSKNAV